MHDPHVKALRYRVVHDHAVDYEKAVPLDHETDVFSLHLEKGAAIFALKEHYPDVPSARAAVEPFIASWEALVYLSEGAGQFQLAYERADIIDRNPQLEPSGKTPKHVSATFTAHMEAGARFHSARDRYPDVPWMFVVSAEVELLLAHYKRYRAGRDKLSSMGYFVYSVLTYSAGGTQKAAQRYGVHKDVLRKLSELTSTRGGDNEARKAPYGLPYNHRERAWIEAVVISLITRAGEYAADPQASRPLISMNDVPSLD